MHRRTTRWLALTIATIIAQRAQADIFPKSPSCTLSGIPLPVNVATGDLFGDGKPALLVASWFRLPGSVEKYDAEKSRVLIFRQKHGKYQQPADREIKIESPFGMAVGDFDDDSIADLAISPYGAFDLRLGKENLLIPHLCATPNGGAGQVVAGKLNEDGCYDFVSGPVWRKWIGGDQWRQGYFCGPKVNDNHLSLAVDLDDDGQSDLVLLSKEGKEIRLYYGPFLNMMVAAEELSQFATLSLPLPAAYIGVGDLNGDSRPDIVASTAYSLKPDERMTFLWRQNSPTGFTDSAEPTETIGGVCGPLVGADMDQDGLDDLIVAEAGDSKLRIFLQKQDKPFVTDVNDADETIVSGKTATFCLADLNDDGYPDVVHNDSSDIRVFLNRGSTATDPE